LFKTTTKKQVLIKKNSKTFLADYVPLNNSITSGFMDVMQLDLNAYIYIDIARHILK